MKESLIMDSSLLVVIPAFNEESVLGRTLDALISSTHNLKLSITDRQIEFILNSNDTILGDMRNVLENGTLKDNLHADPIKPIYYLR